MSDGSKAVFLSYASQDAEAARKICDTLRAAGIEVWLDQSELRGGDAWDQMISRQIKECSLFLPVISANTQARLEGYFRREWRLAVERMRDMDDEVPFLVPVVVDDTPDAGARVPERFRERQWTRLPRGETAPAFCARVKKLLAGGHDAGGSRPAIPHQTRRPFQWWWLAFPFFGLSMALILIFNPPGSGGKKAPATAAPPSEARQLATTALALINKPGAGYKEFAAAIELCAKANRLDPADGEVLATWSQACSWILFHGFDPAQERQERQQTALAKATMAQELAPSSFEARFALGFYFTRGIGGLTATSDEKAQAILQELLRERSDEPRVLLALGMQQGRSNHVEEARATLRRLAENPAYAAQAWGELGWAEMLATNYATAEAAVDRANNILPLWRNLVLKALLALEWRDDTDLASATGRRLADSIMQEGIGMLGAYIDLMRRNPTGALQNLAPIPVDWLSSPGYEGPKGVWVALAYEQLHEQDRADVQWQLALNVIDERLARTTEDRVRVMQAYVLAALNRPAEAETKLRLVDKSVANVRMPWLARGWYVLTLIRLGHADTALDFLEKDPRLTAAVLRLDPGLDPLRALPRFQALQTRLEADPSRWPNAKIAPAAGPADQKSVAVLAFANLSDDKANEYFSDGISEELLNVLAKIPELKVAARTSAFYFKGKDVPIPEIAQKLGVAYVVEGSVRKAGDKVRITAQLIKAADGFHVWSDTFTRDLKDVFAVQDEIAGLIAKNISPRLGNAPAPARATIDPGAYQEYLLGRAAVARASLASVKEGVVHFERAVAVEPAYTDAWVQLSRANVQLGRWGGLQPVAAWAAAKRAIEKAVELEPDSPDVLVALGWVRRCGDWDWRGAEQAFRRALELRPNHAETIASAAVLLFNVGKEEEGLRLAQQAVELDPLNAGAQLDLGVLFLFSQRPKESEQAVRRALQLAPDGQRYHGHVAFALVEQGRYDEAEAELRLEPDDVTRISCHAFIAIGRGRPAEAREPLRQLEEYGRSHSAAADIDVMIAGIYARLGDRDKAFAPLEHSVATRDPSCAWMRSDIYVRSLHDDPRWQAMMRQIGLADDQLK